MSMNLFVEGWDQREELAKSLYSGGKRLYHLRLKNGETKQVRFLHDQPISLFEHVFRDEEGNWQYKYCWGTDDCPYCQAGRKATLRTVHLVWDYEVWTDKDGNEHQGSLKLFSNGRRVGDQLKAIKMAVKDLTKQDIQVTRIGVKQNTTYTFIPTAPSKLSKEAQERITKALTNEDGEVQKPLDYLKDYLLSQIERDKEYAAPVVIKSDAAEPEQVNEEATEFYNPEEEVVW